MLLAAMGSLVDKVVGTVVVRVESAMELLEEEEVGVELVLLERVEEDERVLLLEEEDEVTAAAFTPLTLPASERWVISCPAQELL